MDLLKFFRLRDNDREEILDLPAVKRTHRIGMDKRFQVGRVKHVSQDRQWILIDTIEICNGDNGRYRATYNLWINCGDEWRASKNLVGKYVVFGFYVQSFRNKDLSDSFSTVLTCRFLNVLPSEEVAESLAIDLAESRLFVDHEFLKLSKIQ